MSNSGSQSLPIKHHKSYEALSGKRKGRFICCIITKVDVQINLRAGSGYGFLGDNLRNKYKLIIENDSREKASCDSLLPKVIALEEILRGVGFSSGIHTSSILSRKDFDASLSSFLPIYKKNEHRY